MLRSVIFRALYSPYAAFTSLAEDLAALAGGNGSGIFDKASAALYECNCDMSKRSFEMLVDATVALACNDGDDVPGDFKSSQEYYKVSRNASSWADELVWVGLSCA